MTKPLFCFCPAPEGATLCPACRRAVPVKQTDGVFRVVQHLTADGKAVCVGGGYPVPEGDVKRAYWFE